MKRYEKIRTYDFFSMVRLINFILKSYGCEPDVNEIIDFLDEEIPEINK